ncbi:MULTISPECIES: hypothetical protein [Luteimonas]|nr:MULTISPECIES: hypothetical protein [Luteimonas]
MDKSRAEAIAQAILEPDLKVQAELRHKRAVEAQRLSEGRKRASVALVAMPLGAGIAHFTGHHFSSGALYGAAIGAALGGLVSAWRRRRNAS